MVKWRLCLALAIMLLLPVLISGRSDEDEDEDSENKEDYRQSKLQKKYQNNGRRSEENEEEDDDDDDDDDDAGEDKNNIGGGADRPGQQESNLMTGRRGTLVMATPKSSVSLNADTKTLKKRPLECYVCAYKSETPLKACLDPTKFRVHTITCHSVDDRCFTSVMSRGDTYEAIVRGCRSGCVGSAETSCCELNRCNNQAFAMPVIQSRSKPQPVKFTKNKASKCLHPSVVFFITILLTLQTVGRVAFV